jgi:hypothetical protein
MGWATICEPGLSPWWRYKWFDDISSKTIVELKDSMKIHEWSLKRLWYHVKCESLWKKILRTRTITMVEIQRIWWYIIKNNSGIERLHENSWMKLKKALIPSQMWKLVKEDIEKIEKTENRKEAKMLFVLNSLEWIIQGKVSSYIQKAKVSKH